MDAKKLVEVRRQAEAAVEDMADGVLKVKAFEVILASLLGASPQQPAPTMKAAPAAAPSRKVASSPAKTIGGRMLVLQDEGFFSTQRSIGEVRDELSAHGWHYPLTTLSGVLQGMVRQRKLRRVKGSLGKKRVWKYSNY